MASLKEWDGRKTERKIYKFDKSNSFSKGAHYSWPKHKGRNWSRLEGNVSWKLMGQRRRKWGAGEKPLGRDVNGSWVTLRGQRLQCLFRLVIHPDMERDQGTMRSPYTEESKNLHSKVHVAIPSAVLLMELAH